MFGKARFSVVAAGAALLLLATLQAGWGAGSLSAPSDDALRQAQGGCTTWSVNCNQQDVCIAEGGGWFYYHYTNLGLGIDGPDTNPRCFWRDQHFMPNCGGFGLLHFAWYICT